MPLLIYPMIHSVGRVVVSAAESPGVSFYPPASELQSTCLCLKELATTFIQENAPAMDLHVLRATESKKVVFGMLSVCLSVFLSVCGHHNSKK